MGDTISSNFLLQVRHTGSVRKKKESAAYVTGEHEVRPLRIVGASLWG